MATQAENCSDEDELGPMDEEEIELEEQIEVGGGGEGEVCVEGEVDSEVEYMDEADDTVCQDLPSKGDTTIDKLALEDCEKEEEIEDLEEQQKSIQRLSELKVEECEIYKSLEKRISSSITARRSSSRSPGRRFSQAESCRVPPMTGRSSVCGRTSGESRIQALTVGIASTIGASLGSSMASTMLAATGVNAGSSTAKGGATTKKSTTSKAHSTAGSRGTAASERGSKAQSGNQGDDNWDGYPLRQLIPILYTGGFWFSYCLNAFRAFIPTP